MTSPDGGRLHHVQLAIPQGGEPSARQFYGALLAMTEVPKPPALAHRGGCWFRSGSIELHLGVEAPFRPARKAHPGLVIADFERCLERLEGAGVDVVVDDLLPGFRRAYVDDPFGNRVELLTPIEPAVDSVRAAEQRWAEAHLRSDVERLGGLMHPAYRRLGPHGEQWPADEVLASYGSGERHWSVAESRDLVVRIVGSTAVVTGRWIAKGVNAGQPFDYESWYTSTWVLDHEQWRLVTDQGQL